MKRIIFVATLTTVLYSGNVVWSGDNKPDIFKKPSEDKGCFKKPEDQNITTCKNI
jgi:hypothetical protein